MRNGILILILLVFSAQVSWARPGAVVEARGNSGNQLLGLRLGMYHFTTKETVSPSAGLEVIGGSTNGFAGELFYNYFPVDQLAFELCLGSSSRTDISFVSPEIGEFFGSVNVYPIAVGMKITPLSGWVSERWQPYAHGGGSVVVTRELFDVGRNVDLYRLWERGGSQSRTGFGWWVGAGFESYVARNICVTSSFRYHAISYSESIGGYRDHSGYQIVLGAAYIFRKEAR